MLSYDEILKVNAGLRIKMQAIEPLPARLQTSDQFYKDQETQIDFIA